MNNAMIPPVNVESTAIASETRRRVSSDFAELVKKTNPKGELSDLMVGDRVQVKYTEDDGRFVAHQISILGLKSP